MISRIINKIICAIIKLRYKNVFSFTKLIARNIVVRNYGNNNIVQLAEHCSIKRCNFLFQGNNNTIKIGDRVKLNGVTFWIEDDNNTITIGRNCTFEDGTQLAACEGKSIDIGDDCMFSNNISVRTTDSHSIIDSGGNRINYALDVCIGNHVWVGLQSLILKGGNIGDNSIVAARSVVSSSTPCEQNCILAGQPAKILRKNIGWCRERI